MGLKIKTVIIDGEMRVPPDVMVLLMNLAGHRDLCSQCKTAIDRMTGSYCATGQGILDELLKQPEVEYFKD